MNPIILMIVTVLANAIVTGIIVYLIQKRIESSYTKKLEEFRARLQLSNFEQQTKFAKIHAKRVEALENLYQKFVIVSVGFTEMIDKAIEDYPRLVGLAASMDINGFNTLSIEAPDFENLELKLYEFWAYFGTNRLFLSSGSAQEIENIYLRTGSLIRLIPEMRLFFGYDNLSPDLFYSLNHTIKMLELKIGRIKKQPDLLLLLGELPEEIRKQTERLEKLYKSVADTTL